MQNTGAIVKTRGPVIFLLASVIGALEFCFAAPQGLRPELELFVDFLPVEECAKQYGQLAGISARCF